MTQDAMPQPDDAFPLPSLKSDVLDFLATRRSNLAKTMAGPGPDEAQLETILTIGTRVPDHRKLAPWRLLVIEGEARARIGRDIAEIYKADNPDHPQDRIDFEAARLLRAPLVIVVTSKPVDCPRGTPVWEQELSAGAVCYNLCLAAQASGFGAQWLTEWMAYDERTRAALGLSSGEKLAGMIYIGTPALPSRPRQRPNLSDVVARINK